MQAPGTTGCPGKCRSKILCIVFNSSTILKELFSFCMEETVKKSSFNIVPEI
jgi:hypothetical protein